MVSLSICVCFLSLDAEVVTWGDSNWGGDSSVSDDLENITRLYSNEAAFAAVKSDGTVVTWGNDSFGGDSSGVSAELININEIFSTQIAFAALKDDKTVVT